VSKPLHMTTAPTTKLALRLNETEAQIAFDI